VVVAVTASVTEEIRRECVEDLGMAGFITKPINVSVFLQMFTNILPKLCE
jgi:CheY-like chemotaxis protein